MTFQWPEQSYRDLPKGVQLVRRLLEDWFRAIEDGTVEQRLPDPMYPVSILQEAADRIVANLDAEFERELRSWAYQETVGGYTVGPGFQRLQPAQRLALAQQLHRLLRVVAPDVFPIPSTK